MDTHHCSKHEIISSTDDTDTASDCGAKEGPYFNTCFSCETSEYSCSDVDLDAIAELLEPLESYRLSKERLHAVEFLSQHDMWVKICSSLDHQGILHEFCLLVKSILVGLIDSKTLPLILCLDTAKFANLETSTNMVYSKEAKEFWATVMKIGHSKMLNLMGGRKSNGNIVNLRESRGLFHPKRAEVNFVVPSRHILNKHLKYVPKKLNPGILESTLDLIDVTKQHILAFDGKKIAPGLAENSIGDINLLGVEGPPSLLERNTLLNSQVANIEEMKLEFQHSSSVNVDKLEKCLTDISGHSQIIEEKILKLKSKLTELENHTDSRVPERYKFAITNIKSDIHLMRKWQIEAKTATQNVLHVLAKQRGNLKKFLNSNEVDIIECLQMKVLHKPSQLSSNLYKNCLTTCIKQKSTEWFRLRESVHVTASTAWNGLGMRTLSEQRKHFKQFISKDSSIVLKKEVSERMSYGSRHEIDGIATTVSSLIPALLPGCYELWEQGSYIIPGRIKTNLMCVSPDGLITCCKQRNDDCTEFTHMLHENIVLEIKCPYPTEKSLPVHFSIPNYYAIQLLAEMFVTNSSKAWYVSYSKSNTSLIELNFDARLWDKIFDEIRKLFDCVQPQAPKHKSAFSRQLQDEIQEYVQAQSRFICLIPSLSVGDMECNCSAADSYHHQHNFSLDDIHVNDFVAIDEVLEEVQKVILDGNNLTREKGQEIFACIISDIDRIYDADKPSYFPLAYGLKGYSLPVNKLRQFVNKIRDFCSENNVHILCEAYDGQWCGIVNKSESGEPLTRLQLHRQCWQNNRRKTKDLLLQEICKYSLLSREVLDNWANSSFLHNSIHTIRNLKVEIEHQCTDENSSKYRRLVYLSSADTLEDNTSVYNVITDVRNFCRHEVWVADRRKKTSSKPILPELSIGDILEYLPTELWYHSDDSDHTTPNLSEGFSSQHESVCDSDYELSQNESRDLLQVILNDLRKKSKSQKWFDYSSLDLYHRILYSSNEIARHCTVKDLDIIRDSIYGVTKKYIFTKSSNKQVKVNGLATLFGDSEQWTSTVSRKRNPKSLKTLCTNSIMQSEYPKSVLCCVNAKIEYLQKESEWEAKSCESMYLKVSGISQTVQLFSYPEYSNSRKQFEPRLLDPTHLINNVRSQICKKGIDAFPLSAVQKLAHSTNPAISALILTHVLDQQSTDLTKRFFSIEVQKELKNIGEHEAAKFVGLMRNWFRACDERGIPSLTRVRHLLRMHLYLTADIDWSEFLSFGRYIKGIPVVTFEGILQNISMRIMLYKFAQGGTYCHRALATLCAESSFCEMSDANYSGTTCPKATQLPRLMSHIQVLNHIRCNPDKIFGVCQRKGVVYPSHVCMRKFKARKCLQTNDLFKDHLFDILPPDRKKRSKTCRDYGNVHGQETGVEGLRRKYYKPDMSQYTTNEKLGIKEEDLMY